MLIAALMLWFAPRANPGTNSPDDSRVEAQFLLNFAKFIDWPEKSFASPQSHFIVCVVGHDPFGRALDQDMLHRMINNRAIEIVRYPRTATLLTNVSCQIAFLSASESQHFEDIIRFFDRQSTLLVADTDGFAELGGTIEFHLKENRVRFAINPEAADRADLKVSSKLLAVAQIVHDDPGKREKAK